MIERSEQTQRSLSFATQGPAGLTESVSRPRRPKDRKDQRLPASYCSQIANESRDNQAVREERRRKRKRKRRRRVIGWLKGDGGW